MPTRNVMHMNASKPQPASMCINICWGFATHNSVSDLVKGSVPAWLGVVSAMSIYSAGRGSHAHVCRKRVDERRAALVEAQKIAEERAATIKGEVLDGRWGGALETAISRLCCSNDKGTWLAEQQKVNVNDGVRPFGIWCVSKALALKNVESSALKSRRSVVEKSSKVELDGLSVDQLKWCRTAIAERMDEMNNAAHVYRRVARRTANPNKP